MITVSAGGYQVRPGGFSPEVLGNDMIHSQIPGLLTAVLALELVPAENFLFGKFNSGAGAFHHILQANDGWFGKILETVRTTPRPSITMLAFPIRIKHIARRVEHTLIGA